MEMKSSRRSFDGSSLELGLKKPRLTEDDPIIISQYKRALAELTINSKPIINNLTIIAGENLCVAKTIAAIICGNILEIPSEHKLPSLYLLDSIVKNIGRDYIKYFAARLPEVFCKAYRKVEPSVRPGMHRLFVTWRKVFPLQQLQLIEKELGFTTGINGSSSATPRDDSQAQQPAQRIHVNPKYLEARQCLQEPIRCAQKDQLNERAREKSVSSTNGNRGYDSDLSRGSALRLRTGEKYKEEGFGKSWYDSASGKILSQKNVMDVKHGFQNLSRQMEKSSTLMDMSWQNTEEEEYRWDDVNSAGKDWRPSEDSDKSGLDDQPPRPRSIHGVRLKVQNEASANSLSREDRGQASLGNQMSSIWSEGSRRLGSGANSRVGPSFQLQKDTIQLETLSLGLAETARESVGPTKQPRENFSQVVNNLTKEYQTHSKTNTDPKVSPFSRSKLEPFHKNIEQESPESETSGRTSMNSLLAAVMKSGVLGSKPTVDTTLESCDNGSQINVEQPELQARKALSTASNPVPVSSLLSSLVAKGLISTNDELSFSSKPAAKTPDALVQSTKEEIKGLAPFAFKPDLIRELHPDVINKLLDDVPHQCGTCGLQLKCQAQLDRHLEWHTLRNSKRRWYLKSAEWIAGTDSLLNGGISVGPVGASSSELSSECTEVMVPADEDQCICILCGQFFEDSYDEESDKWMFKGAVYMNNLSCGPGSTQSPIVHKNCKSESSHNLTITQAIESEFEV